MAAFGKMSALAFLVKESGASKDVEECERFFGDMGGPKSWRATVVDIDVGITQNGHLDDASSYCDYNSVSSPCKYIHYAGPFQDCVIPGPPDLCHRYNKVMYHDCPELDSINATNTIDTTGLFNERGIFIPCIDRAMFRSSYCYGPGATEPEPCNTCSHGWPGEEEEEALPEVASASAVSKPGCNHYFGNVTGGLVTVIDPDVGTTSASTAYCDMNNVASPCTVCHLCGTATEQCVSPAPPDGCHRYIKTTYSKCDELENMNLYGAVIARDDPRFTADGVLVACAEHALETTMTCFGPDPDDPEACGCPATLV